MKPKPRKDLTASVRARLLKLAKQRGEDLDLVLKRFGIERLLYRLSQSPQKANFILKGAMLFELWMGQAHRTTKDLDLLGAGTTDNHPAWGLPHLLPASREASRFSPGTL